MRTGKYTVILAVPFLALILIARATQALMAPYDIMDLGINIGGSPFGGSTGGYAINDSGQIAGDFYSAQGTLHGFLWENGTVTELGLPGVASEAFDLNDSGQVVGHSNNQAVIWENSTMTQLPNLGDSELSRAHGINNAGQVVGWAGWGDLKFGEKHAFLWDNTNGIQDLGPSGADSISNFGINNSGQVVGWTFIGEQGPHHYHATLWENGVPIDLGYLDGLESSIGKDINDRGQVVGYSHSDYQNDNTGLYNAFLWDSTGGMQNLGTLDGKPNSVARAINDRGQVVGNSWKVPWEPQGNEHAWLWEEGVLTDLYELIPAESAWEQIDAYDINNQGQIVGRGFKDGEMRAFLMTPTWEAYVQTDLDYYLTMTLGDTFSFEYWWEIGQEPDGFNLDILFFRDGEWRLFGWDLNFDGSSTEWEIAKFMVPEELRGLETEIRFRVFDFGAFTDPTVYLRNISSEPVPEPSTVLLIASGLLGLMGLRTIRNQVRSSFNKTVRYQMFNKCLIACFVVPFLVFVFAIKNTYALPYALYFSEQAQGVRVPDSDSLDVTGPLTVEVWVKADPSIYDECFNFIVSKNMSGTGYMLLTVGWYSSKTIRFSGTAKDKEGANSPYLPPTGEWMHLAGVWSEGTNKLYVNGQLVTEQPAPDFPEANEWPLYLGWSPFGGDTNWRGTIDEVRIWNIAKTEEQILGQMCRELIGTELGLVAYWNFNDGPGSETLTDSTTYGNDGVLISGAGSSLPEWVISDAPVAPVPEPSTMLLITTGLVGLVGWRRKFRR